MEPANINPPPDDPDARLESLLREPAAVLPDAGFSLRVIAALPPPTPVGRPWSHTTLGALAAGFGMLIALASVALWGDWNANWAPVLGPFSALDASLGDPVVLAAIALAVVSVAYALRLTPRRLWA